MKRYLYLLLGCSALLYALFLGRFYVGYFNDDAVYVLASQSLLQGHYSHAPLLNNRPMTYFMPGFPLALVPWTALAAPSWEFLKGLSFIATLISTFLLWKLSKSWLAERERMGVALLWALNPVVIGFSGTVLAEPFFILLCLAAFYLLQRASETTDRSLWVWVAFLAGWAALTRPHGFLLALSIGIALMSQQKIREACSVTILALLPLGLFMARNLSLTQRVSGYSLDWENIFHLFSGGQGPRIILSNAVVVIETLLLQNIFPVFWSSFIPAAGVWNTLIGSILLGTLVTGAYTLARKNQGITLIAVCGFVLAYLAVQLLWLAVDVRFCLPIIPYLFIFLVAGLIALKQRFHFSRPWEIGWGMAFLLVYVVGWGFALHQTFISSGDHRAPKHTFAWIRENIPRDGRLVTTSATAFMLHTERAAIHRPPPGDAQEMRYWMLRENAPYLVALPMRLLNLQSSTAESPSQLWGRAIDQAANAPEEFKLVHDEPAEQTRIYQAIPDPTFVQAYALFREAQRSAAQGNFPEARKNARAALALAPRLQKIRDWLATLPR